MALVVLAEDNVDHQRIVEKVLRRLGHDVTVVDDGRAALAAVAECRPDMVIADVDMPRLDGVQLCRTLRADPELADIPIMLLTGYLPPSDPGLSSAGATAGVGETLCVKELTTALRRQLGEDLAPRAGTFAAGTDAAPTDAGSHPLAATAGAVTGSPAFLQALLEDLDARVVACDAAGRLV